MAKKGSDLFDKYGQLGKGVSKSSLTKSQKAYRDKLLKRGVEKQKQRGLDNPATLTAPLTPRTLKYETEAAVKDKFGAQKSSLLNQREASKINEQTIGNWFDQYRNDVANAQQRAGDIYGQAQGQVQGLQNASSAQDEQNRQSRLNQMQQSATTRGAAVSGEGDQTSQQASASRRAALDAFRSNLSGQGAAEQSYLSAKQPIIGAQKFTEQGKEQSRRNALDRSLTDLAGQAGAFRTTYKTAARETERKNQLERQAFGLQVSKADQAAREAAGKASNAKATLDLAAGRLKETTRHDQTAEQIAQQNADTAAQRRAAAKQKAAGKGGGGKGGSKGLTRAQVSAKVKQLRTVRSSLSQKSIASVGIQKAASDLQKSGKVDSREMAFAAVEGAITGGAVSQRTARLFKKRYGVGLKVVKGGIVRAGGGGIGIGLQL